ncbi:MAG TPA: SGNH/GDSL hydrolase family protein, partial [Pirellulales bacterium]|nr:SGNH/GDSL hydrolase family protein [Pirellulales bacterium]
RIAKMIHGGSRIGTVVVLLFATSLANAGEPLDASVAKHEGSILWYDLKLLDVEGQGWTETKAPFDRLPAKAEGVVRDPVWQLSRHSAGLCARFVSNATTIKARWTLTSENLAMPHMPATGVSGIDLYVKFKGRWRWLANGRPSGVTTSLDLAAGLPDGEREYLLYLPLYNGVTSVEVGIAPEHQIGKAESYAADRAQPIVFYGTSITQGGCASRPGMVHTAILGRRLGRPVINLGFSGNGKMEPELAGLLAELDPALYVLDCLPNMNADEVAQRVEPFISTIRRKRPGTPILLVEDRNYTDGFLVEGKRVRNEASHAALKAVYERLLAAGDKHLGYLRGEYLLGEDGEGTVDTSHPTDLGFLRQAAVFQSALEPLLR